MTPGTARPSRLQARKASQPVRRTSAASPFLLSAPLSRARDAGRKRKTPPPLATSVFLRNLLGYASDQNIREAAGTTDLPSLSGTNLQPADPQRTDGPRRAHAGPRCPIAPAQARAVQACSSPQPSHVGSIRTHLYGASARFVSSPHFRANRAMRRHMRRISVGHADGPLPVLCRATQAPPAHAAPELEDNRLRQSRKMLHSAHSSRSWRCGTARSSSLIARLFRSVWPESGWKTRQRSCGMSDEDWKLHGVRRRMVADVGRGGRDLRLGGLRRVQPSGGGAIGQDRSEFANAPAGLAGVPG